MSSSAQAAAARPAVRCAASPRPRYAGSVQTAPRPAQPAPIPMRANAIGVVPAASAARSPSCCDSPPPGAMLAKS